MAFDLSWLWELLNSIVSTMQSWFASLWTQVQNIVNTGQGIFAGLIAFGSQLWDAIIKGATEFGNWLYKGLKWFYDGLVEFAKTFGQWVNTAFAWIGSAISWVAMQVYNFAQWFYNIIYFVWNWIVNSIVSLWNTLVSWFSGVATAIGTWWGSVISGINTWFTNLLKTFRQKIITTIEADLTITMAWKGAERFLAPKKLSDFGYGIVGIIASPIIGRLVGTVVDAVVPLPSTSSYPLIPDISGFSYTPPSLVIPTPTEKPYPSMGAPLTPIGYFVGVWEEELPILVTSDARWVTPATISASITVTHSEDLAPSDGQANILLSYETVVA